MSVVRLSLLSVGVSSQSTGISNVQFIVGGLLPIHGTHRVLLSSFRPLYCHTIIPGLLASSYPPGDLDGVNWLVAQAISGFCVLNHVNFSTKLCALIGMTMISGWWTMAKCSIDWTSLPSSGDSWHSRSPDPKGCELWCELHGGVVQVY